MMMMMMIKTMSSSSSSSFSSLLVVRRLLLLARMMMMMMIVIAPVVVVVVHAWGKQGHEMVGNVAYALLDNTTQHWVDNILQGAQHTPNNDTTTADDDDCEDCASLGQVADWADAVKYTHDYHWTAPLHYADVRNDLIVPGGCPVIIDDVYHKNSNNNNNNKDTTTTTTTNSSRTGINSNCHFEYERDCARDVCVAGAITNYTHRLLIRNQDRNWKNNNSNSDNDDMDISLMFLVHFVGDIHQPLHVARSTDLGGNAIHVHWPTVSSSSSSSTTTTLSSSSSASSETALGRRRRRRRRRLLRSTTTTLHCDGLFLRRDDDGLRLPLVLGRNKRRRHPHYPVDNLHAVWDDGIIERAMRELYNESRPNMEGAVMDRIQRAKQQQQQPSGTGDRTTEYDQWRNCSVVAVATTTSTTSTTAIGRGGVNDCTSTWAQESLVYALRYAYNNVNGLGEITNGTTLSLEYYTTHGLPIVVEQLAKAAVRLANVIEQVHAAQCQPASEPAKTKDCIRVSSPARSE
jgi:S1/P1 Nuclease